MSWRSSGGSRPRASSPGGGPPLLDPTLQGLMLAAVVVGVVGLGLMVAFGGVLGQSTAQTVAKPTTVAARPTAPPVATAAPTVAATVAPTAGAATTAPTASTSSGTSASTGTGDPTAGQALFAALPNGQTSCNICHNVAPGSGTLVGPSLSGISTRAGSTVPGESAEQYIHNSIMTPSAHVVSGFTDGLMPSTYGTTLTPEQVNNLVAYLMSLP